MLPPYVDQSMVCRFGICVAAPFACAPAVTVLCAMQLKQDE
jgi:hypothetical protein